MNAKIFMNGTRELQLIDTSGDYAIFKQLNYAWADLYPNNDFIVAYCPTFKNNTVTWVSGTYDMTLQSAILKINK